MTREQARREIDSLDFYLQNHTDDYGEESHTAMMMAKDALSSSEKPNKWIPVSERVPEDEEEVLCFLGSEEMAVLFLRNDWGQNEWVDGGFATGSYDVIAWMPLPGLYKAESEDKE